MLPSGGVYLAALSTRLENADCTMASSPMRLAADSIDDLDLARMRGAREHVLAQHRRHRRHVDGLPLDRCIVGLEARQLEQVLDDACHAIGLAAHLGDRRRQLAEPRVGAEGLEITGDHGERRAQLVRGIGDEILAHLLEAHFARDVAQHAAGAGPRRRR